MPKCLVVDDVEVSRFTAKEFLEGLGVEVSLSSDRDDAQKKLQNDSFDLVLLDWHLGRDSGLDVLKEIKQKYGNKLYVVLFSGVESSDKATTEAMNAGADHFIQKPTTRDKLNQCLQKLGLL